MDLHAEREALKGPIDCRQDLRGFRKLVRTVALGMMCLVPVLTAQALDPHGTLDHFGHQVWRTDSGLPQNTVHCILQTRDGYLWLGTDGGLVRFDGVSFVTFDRENTPRLRSDTINDLLEDANGALWISTAAGLLRYQRGIFASYTTDQGLPANTVWLSYQDRLKRLWAMTAAGPARLAGDRFEPVAGAEAAVPLSRQQVAEDAQGNIWIGTGDGLFAVDAHPGASHPTSRFLAGTAVEALTPDLDNSLWIGTSQGLTRWHDGALHPVTRFAPRTEVTALFADGGGGLVAGTTAGVVRLGADGSLHPLATHGVAVKQVEQFFRDRRGTLWLATRQGAFRVRGDQLEAFAQGTELASNRVLAIQEDREGNLWLGTESGGLNLLRDLKFTTYTTRDGLSGNVILSGLETSDGAVWVGTDGAGLNRRTPGGFVHYSTADGLSSNVILSLAGKSAKDHAVPEAGSQDDLWVGTPDGLNLLHRDHPASGGRESVQVKRYTSADGLPDDFIRSLYTDQDNTLWVGTRRGLAHLVDGNFTVYSTADGLGSNLIGAISRSAQATSDLWIGTAGGLSRLRAGKLTNFALSRDPGANTVTAIADSGADSLWLGTNGGSLVPFGADRRHLPVLPAGIPSTIFGVLEDRSGLWLSTTIGIYQLAYSDLPFGNSVTAYGTADGMNIRECSGGGHPSAWKARDGALWFATQDGVSVIDPEHMPVNRIPPPVMIENVLLDDRPRTIDQELTIEPGVNRLEFQYAGLSFSAPQKVRYRYQLEGFDRGWTEAGARRSAFYTNLPPGHFRFRVLAANNDGVWNDTGAVFSLRQLPHYYQTWWFYTALGMAAALLGYLVYRWRVHQVEAQFGAVLAERGRLAREIHDTLAQGFVGVSVQLEVLTQLLRGASQSTARTAPQAVTDQLDQVRGLVRESLAEARASIWKLRSEAAGQQDLPARLTQSAQRTAGTSSAKVYFQVKGTYRPGPRAVEDELLRIAQEAVANAARHGEATRIDVQLIYEAGRMLLLVADDGRGFTPLPNGSGPAGHFGIQGMHERAQQIGARLNLESAPGTGTRVSVEAPLK